MVSKYLENLIKPHENLFLKVDSQQFKLSRNLLQKKHELNFSQEEMAEILQVSLDEYIDMEFGENSIPIEKFLRSLKQIETISPNDKPNILFNDIYQSDKLTKIKEPLNFEKPMNLTYGHNMLNNNLTMKFSSNDHKNFQISSDNIFFNVNQSDANKKRDGEAA